MLSQGAGMASDEENDNTSQITREEERLSYEIYYYINNTICERGVVKISDLKKIYQKAVSNDKSIAFRPLQDVLKTINENFIHWQGWRAVQCDDRITYVDVHKKGSGGDTLPNETERVIGVLKNALMYVFVATKPSSRFPGVTHEDLMNYMESSLSTSADHKLSQSHMELLKKQIAPNARADFIRKGYLTFSKSVNENDEEVFRYEWGPTARQSVDPTELVRLFQKLTGMSSSQLKEQTERAVEMKTYQLDAAKNGVVITTRGGK
ncbi:unnamed protein product [Caenorhabditis sp. 36 PRJEB53466]|nr:unnamed protein product [Caenorhabditis sp. 36 PRJEB53466]